MGPFETQFRQAECKVIRTFAQSRLPDHPNITVEIRPYYKEETDKEKQYIILTMIEKLVQGPPTETELMKFPKTWWDHFKLRFLSRWLKVEWTEIVGTTYYNVCPHINCAEKDHMNFIVPEWRDSSYGSKPYDPSLHNPLGPPGTY